VKIKQKIPQLGEALSMKQDERRKFASTKKIYGSTLGDEAVKPELGFVLRNGYQVRQVNQLHSSLDKSASFKQL